MNKKIFLSLIFLLVAFLTRVFPHPWNWTAVGGCAIWLGFQKQSQWVNHLMIWAVILLTDLVLGSHGTQFFVLTGFSAMLVTTFLVSKTAWSEKYQWTARITASFLASLGFFLWSNFGVWFQGHLYPQTIEGLIQCYLLGLPFWKAQVLADLSWGLGFFWAADQILSQSEERVIVKN